MIEVNNKTKSRIDIDLIKRITNNFTKYFKIKNKDISIALVGDKTIRELNKKYRKKDRITDVLAFTGEGKELGELIIDYQQIKRQAPKFSGSLKEELVFILVHGLLHLLGHDDKTEKGRIEMENLANHFISLYDS